MQKVVFYIVFYGMVVLLAIWLGDKWLGRNEESRIQLEKQGESRTIQLREGRPGMKGTIVPQDHFLAGSDLLENKKYRLETDENGFWLPSAIHESPDVSVYFLGGSTTACVYNDDKKRFPYLSGRLLEERLSITCNSFNAGFSNNNSFHSLNVLLNKIVDKKPDYVVLMHACNDLGYLSRYGHYWTTESKSLKVVQQKRGKTSTPQALLDVWKSAFPHVSKALKSKPSKKEATTPDVKPVIRDLALTEAFAQNLEAFVSLCRAYDVEPVLMTQAHKIATGDSSVMNLFDVLTHPDYEHQLTITFDDWLRLEKLFNQTTRAMAARLDVKLIDLEKALDGQADLMYDAYHFTDEGNEKASAIIADSLASFIKRPTIPNQP